MDRRYLILLLPLLLPGCDNSPPEQKALRSDLNALKSDIKSGISQGEFHLRYVKIKADLDAFRSTPLKVAPEIDDVDVYLGLTDSAWRILSQPDCKGYNGELNQDCFKDNPSLVAMLTRLDVPPADNTPTIEESINPALATVTKKIDAAVAALSS